MNQPDIYPHDMQTDSVIYGLRPQYAQSDLKKFRWCPFYGQDELPTQTMKNEPGQALYPLDMKF